MRSKGDPILDAQQLADGTRTREELEEALGKEFGWYYPDVCKDAVATGMGVYFQVSDGKVVSK